MQASPASTALALAAAVMACHTGGVVVRDLRPEKVLIALDGIKVSALAGCLSVHATPAEVCKYSCCVSVLSGCIWCGITCSMIKIPHQHVYAHP